MADRQRGSAPKKAASARRNSFTRPKAVSRALLIALAAASIIVAVLYIFVGKQDTDVEQLIDDGTILQGVSINGIDVSGMDYRSARAAVLPSVEELLYQINITVAHSSTAWLLTAADMQPVSTLDSAITEALLLGRNGSIVDNAKQKDAIAENGYDIPVYFIPDEATLKARLTEIAAVLDVTPVEPYAEAVSSAEQPEFIFHEGIDGYVLNEDALYADIVALLEAGQLSATLEPSLEYSAPSATLEDIKANTQLVSTFQTSFGGSRAARNENRVGNIQKACTLLNGHSVENGTEFSFNGYIGPRTEEGGWPLAPGIVNGNRYEDEPGGGICQVSTTLYNALLCANASMQRGSTLEEILEQNIEGISITERKHHSWPSSYVDTGLDSTVTGTVENGKSLDFVNNTGYPIYIFAYCDQVAYTVTVYIYGKPLEEGVTYQVRGVVEEVIEPGETIITYDTTKPIDYSEVTITARKGYKAAAYRDKYLNGVLVEGETELLYTETYRAVTGEKIVGTGGAEPPASTTQG